MDGMRRLMRRTLGRMSLVSISGAIKEKGSAIPVSQEPHLIKRRPEAAEAGDQHRPIQKSAVVRMRTLALGENSALPGPMPTQGVSRDSIASVDHRQVSSLISWRTPVQFGASLPKLHQLRMQVSSSQPTTRLGNVSGVHKAGKGQ